MVWQLPSGPVSNNREMSTGILKLIEKKKKKKKKKKKIDKS